MNLIVRVCAAAAVAISVLILPPCALAQPPDDDAAPSRPYSPPTSSDRLKWAVQGTVSVPVLGVNAASSAWMTSANWPKEWHRTAAGFGRRFADVEVSSAITNSLEAGIGSLWGEDPRYRRSGKHGAAARVRHALITTVLAPRPDGHLAPAWGRFYATAAGNLIENAWLPPSARTRRQTVIRMSDGIVERLVSNVWDEFWPDVRRYLPARIP